MATLISVTRIRFLFCVIIAGWSLLPQTVSAGSSGDSLQAFQSLDDSLLLLRRKELDTETRIERLQIDLLAVEKKWKETREIDTENRIVVDSINGPALTTKVQWEQLSSYRTDLENTGLLLTCYQRHRSILRIIRSARSETNARHDYWRMVIDSIESFRTTITEECTWRRERLAETRFELTALESLLSGSTLSSDDRRLLRKRRIYLTAKLGSDSLMNVHGMQMDTLLAGYLTEAQTRLKEITLRQQSQRLLRKVLGIWSYELSNTDGKPLTIGKIILALFVIFAGLKLAQIISRLIAHAIKRKSHFDAGIIDSGQKLFFYTFAALFTLYALHMLQVPLTAFTMIGGALALGIGFGSQNIIKNFISGIILLLERPMKAGDFLEIDGAIGTVETIGLRSTRIRTPGNVHMVIPNSSFLEKNVINWTLSDRLIRLELQVGVQYGSPVLIVKKLLLDAAEKTERVLKRPEPEVLFSDFGDNALIFHLYFWMNISTIIDRKRILSELRYSIYELFTTADIVIAYPQRDVHLDTLSPLNVHLLASNQTGSEDPSAENKTTARPG